VSSFPSKLILASDDEGCKSDRDEVFRDRSGIGAEARDRCQTNGQAAVRADRRTGDGRPSRRGFPSRRASSRSASPTSAPLTNPRRKSPGFRAPKQRPAVRPSRPHRTAATAAMIPQMPSRTSSTALSESQPAIRRQKPSARASKRGVMVCFQTADCVAEVPVSAAEAFAGAKAENREPSSCARGLCGQVVFQDESLEIDISLIDRLLGFHGSFHIPLAHVTNAYGGSLEGLELQYKLEGTNAGFYKSVGVFANPEV